MEIKGKYGTAKVFNSYVEPTADIVDHWKPIWNYKG